ncbi:MAG: ATP synthase F1 subunit delta [Deltaproteobacteria bacterium]|nr:ATP synthase F1 subunit delta [Deltaproteobacteria bacterium]
MAKKNGRLATVYSKALFEIAVRHKREEEILKNIKSFSDVLRKHANLATLSKGLGFSNQEIFASVHEICSLLQFEKLSTHFIGILIEKKRLGLIHDIYDSYHSLYREKNGILKSVVVTAHDVAPAIKQEIMNVLSKITGKKIQPSFKVDPEILGGISAQIGSRIYDASLRTHIQSLLG